VVDCVSFAFIVASSDRTASELVEIRYRGSKCNPMSSLLALTPSKVGASGRGDLVRGSSLICQE
jgi:hypothetical protein